jgi:hypothetical protein
MVVRTSQLFCQVLMAIGQPSFGEGIELLFGLLAGGSAVDALEVPGVGLAVLTGNLTNMIVKRFSLCVR